MQCTVKGGKTRKHFRGCRFGVACGWTLMKQQLIRIVILTKFFGISHRHQCTTMLQIWTSFTACEYFLAKDIACCHWSNNMLLCSFFLTIKQAMTTNFEFNQLPFFNMQVWNLCTTKAQCFSMSTLSEIRIYDFEGCPILSNMHLNIAQIQLTEMRLILLMQQFMQTRCCFDPLHANWLMFHCWYTSDNDKHTTMPIWFCWRWGNNAGITDSVSCGQRPPGWHCLEWRKTPAWPNGWFVTFLEDPRVMTMTVRPMESSEVWNATMRNYRNQPVWGSLASLEIYQICWKVGGPTEHLKPQMALQPEPPSANVQSPKIANTKHVQSQNIAKKTSNAKIKHRT